MVRERPGSLKAFKVVDGRPPGRAYPVHPLSRSCRLRALPQLHRVRSASASQARQLSAAWRARLSSTWLVVNENPDELAWNGMDPRLRLATLPNLDGLIAVRPPADVPEPAATAGYISANIVDASGKRHRRKDDAHHPQDVGRDLEDIDIVKRDGAEWTRFGSYMHSRSHRCRWLPNGAKEVVTIGPQGLCRVACRGE